jgi:hypothetical protein
VTIGSCGDVEQSKVLARVVDGFVTAMPIMTTSPGGRLSGGCHGVGRVEPKRVDDEHATGRI